MTIPSFPFRIIDWNNIPKEEHKGETGIAYWQVQMMNNTRVRMVEYQPAIKPTTGAARDISSIASKVKWIPSWQTGGYRSSARDSVIS